MAACSGPLQQRLPAMPKPGRSGDRADRGGEPPVARAAQGPLRRGWSRPRAAPMAGGEVRVMLNPQPSCGERRFGRHGLVDELPPGWCVQPRSAGDRARGGLRRGDGAVPHAAESADAGRRCPGGGSALATSLIASHRWRTLPALMRDVLSLSLFSPDGATPLLNGQHDVTADQNGWLTCRQFAGSDVLAAAAPGPGSRIDGRPGMAPAWSGCGCCEPRSRRCG